MLFEPRLQPGHLLRRYKRFLADVKLDTGETIVAHCPNTGAMTGCAEPGSRVWCSAADNPRRKLSHTLEVVQTANGNAGIYSARANKLVQEAIGNGQIEALADYETVRTEVPIPDGGGRFDLGLTASSRPDCLVEIKSVTLALGGGEGAFPDAVSERAVKHVVALQSVAASGMRAVLVFCAQHEGINRVRPAHEIHPAYAAAIDEAMNAGVEVLALGCVVNDREIRVRGTVPFTLHT